MRQASLWFAVGALTFGLGLPHTLAAESAGLPTTQEGYAELARQQQSRALVSPALGYQAPQQPGRMSKAMSAVRESRVARSFKSMFQKASDTLSPSRPSISRSAPPAEDPPIGPGAHVLSARGHERSNDFAAAAEQYKQALKKEPHHLDALLGYGRLLDRQGQLDEAIQRYRQATLRHPRSAPAFNDLGLCLARQNKLEASVEALAQATRLQPDRKLYRNNIATVLVELGRGNEAYQHLSAAHPPAVAHYNLGYLLSQKGQAREATYHFQQALAKDPSLTAAQQWIDLLSGAPAVNPSAAPIEVPDETAASEPLGATPAGEEVSQSDAALMMEMPVPPSPRFGQPAPVATQQPPSAVQPAPSTAQPLPRRQGPGATQHASASAAPATLPAVGPEAAPSPEAVNDAPPLDLSSTEFSYPTTDTPGQTHYYPPSRY